ETHRSPRPTWVSPGFTPGQPILRATRKSDDQLPPPDAGSPEIVVVSALTISHIIGKGGRHSSLPGFPILPLFLQLGVIKGAIVVAPRRISRRQIDEHDVRDVLVGVLLVGGVDGAVVIGLKLVDALIVLVPCCTGGVTR